MRLQIPSIGVNAPVMNLGVNSDNTVQTPPFTTFHGVSPYNLAGWYDGGASPGRVGSAVFLGHDNFNGRSAVFDNLGGVHVGDKIYVTTASGKTYTYQVYRTAEIPKTECPTNEVYGSTGQPEIRVITCGGAFNAATGHHVNNILVFGKLA